MCKDERIRSMKKEIMFFILIFTFDYFWQENNTERHVCLGWLSYFNYGRKKERQTENLTSTHTAYPLDLLLYSTCFFSSSSHPPCDATHRHVVRRAQLSVSLHKTKARWSTPSGSVAVSSPCGTLNLHTYPMQTKQKTIPKQINPTWTASARAGASHFNHSNEFHLNS